MKEKISGEPNYYVCSRRIWARSTRDICIVKESKSGELQKRKISWTTPAIAPAKDYPY